MPRIVVVESPYSAKTRAGLSENVMYARRCLHDSLLRGESPYASHLLYTQPGVLDDDIAEERELGISAGLAFQEVADLVAVYTDLGVSLGMARAVKRARKHDIPIEYRSLKNPPR